MNKSLKIEVPQTLGAIKLREYQKYLKIVDKNKDAESPDLVNMKALEIFCGISLKEAYGLKLTDFSFLVEHLNNLFNHKTPLVQRFTLKGSDGVEVEFGFMPKLEDITAGEFIDLDNYIGDWDNMHRAMAVLYRPVTFEKRDRYLIEEYEGSERYAEVMQDAPVDIVIGAMVFFYRLGKKLCKYTMDYLLLQQKQSQASTQEKALERNGDGINQFMLSLEKTYQELVKSQKFHYTSV